MVMEVSISGRHNHCPISGHARRHDDAGDLPLRYREKYRRVSPKRTVFPPDVEYQIKQDWLANKLSLRAMAPKYNTNYETLRQLINRKGWPKRTTRPLKSYPL